MSATGIGMGARTALATLLLTATAAGALAACGHYGPPVRAEEYRKEQAAEQRRERDAKEALTPNDETLVDPDNGPPAPGTGELEGLEAP